jgi:hypothetical protein
VRGEQKKFEQFFYQQQNIFKARINLWKLSESSTKQRERGEFNKFKNLT